MLVISSPSLTEFALKMFGLATNSLSKSMFYGTTKREHSRAQRKAGDFSHKIMFLYLSDYLDHSPYKVDDDHHV